jgi:uncharacterized protein YggU (UPF0235/DUF167 family)
VVGDVPHPAARHGPYTVSGRARLTVRVHARARTERLEWDGSTLQLRVREPKPTGGQNAAVIRAVARWADVAPSQVAIVSGAAARHKLVEIAREDALPLRLCAMTGLSGRQGEQSLGAGHGASLASSVVLGRSWARAQWVVATLLAEPLLGHRSGSGVVRKASRASTGIFHPRVLRGRPLNSAAT